MTKKRLGIVPGILAVVLLTCGCTCLSKGPGDEEQIRSVLLCYKQGMEGLDSEAAKALLTDDYTSPSGGGREEMGRLMKMMKDREMTMSMNVEEAAVTVDGDNATASGIKVKVRDREMVVNYSLEKTEHGWKISSISY